MGEINSPIGGRTFESTEGMKKFTVHDASSQDFEEPAPRAVPHPQAGQRVELTAEQFNQMRAERMRQSEQAQRGTMRNNIETLIGIGRATKQVKIEGEEGFVVFTIQTLKSRERHLVAKYWDKLNTQNAREAMFDIRRISLALAIKSVDNMSFDSLLGVDSYRDFEMALEEKQHFLDELDDVVVTRLYSEYEKLQIDNMNRFNMQTPEGAKEVAEQIKKSS